MGRKRHVPVDMTGLLMALVVTTANGQDRDGAKRVLRDARGRWPRRRVIVADGGSAGPFIARVKEGCGWNGPTIWRPTDAVGFVPLAERWVVERPFGWFTKDRRLAKDDEADIEMSEAVICAARIHRMVRRFRES